MTPDQDRKAAEEYVEPYKPGTHPYYATRNEVVDAFLAGIAFERKRGEEEREMLRRIAEALEGILSNVSLDWYAQQFHRNEAPTGASSGVVAMIHNRETTQRAAEAFEQARMALSAWKARSK